VTLSPEDLADIRREVLEFKAAQRERRPLTVAEELEPANEFLQRLLARYGQGACRAVNEVLDPNYRRCGELLR
jgi:hypothetical protein